MTKYVLAALFGLSALTTAAQAGIMIDATHGPIMITVDSR